MTAGGWYTGLNKGSLILFIDEKTLGLNSHSFVCITATVMLKEARN